VWYDQVRVDGIAGTPGRVDVNGDGVNDPIGSKCAFVFA
jgi:hypothetical protein